MERVEEKPYKVLLEGGTGEIIEKKSRFIATVRKVETEQEAVSFIEETKKKYWDAKHNCSAFVIGKGAELTRCSDDGEPSGTAGRPMLEVLLKEEIRNVAVVVTRYFGGTLLGTGGLVRAYTQAVKTGLEDCAIGVMRFGVRICFTVDYNDVGKILYLLTQMDISPENAEYTEEVKIQVLISHERAAELKKKVTEATQGKAKMQEIDKLYFVDKNEAF